MVRKHQVLGIIKKYHKIFSNALKLNKLKINYHIRSSKDQGLRKEGLYFKGYAAICLYNKKALNQFDIVIYYDLQKDRKDLIGTVLHELLHIRFRSFDKLIKRTKYKLADELEERLITDLERLLKRF